MEVDYKPTLTNANPLGTQDFERLRCNKCDGYLNHPPVVAYAEKGADYLECGRCFNEEEARLKGWHPIRNHSLEFLANLTPFPCRFHKEGCAERRIWPQIEMHEKQCLHRAFSCQLSMLSCCEYRGGMKNFLEHFKEKHSESLINDGIFKESFDEDFDKYYLVNDNINLFILQMKCDVNVKKLWFISYLLEENSQSGVCSLEFGVETTENSFIVKHAAVFQPLAELDTDKALQIDLDTLRSLVSWSSGDITCKIRLLHAPTHHSSEILKEIQCPVCWDFMQAKIFMCKNGHNMCSKCKELVKHCPTCRDEVLDVRNIAMEKMIRLTLLPCKNHSHGCTFIGSLEDLLYHLRFCRFDMS